MPNAFESTEVGLINFWPFDHQMIVFSCQEDTEETTAEPEAEAEAESGATAKILFKSLIFVSFALYYI